MEKTLFAGLTVLDQDESILTDGGAFIGRDRKIIDRLLEVGAVTHRHDGSSGLGNPNQPIGASATGSAGQLPGDLTFSIGYTLEDDQLGETLISPLTVISTAPVLARPAVAPTAVADYSSGTLLADTYYYAISHTDGGGGETPIGPSVVVERSPGFPNGRILLTGLDDGMAAAGASGWRLYRAVGGGDFHLLAEGSGDAYADDGSDSVDCDARPLTETENSTNGDNGLLLHLPSADGLVSDAAFINVYLSEDGSFSGNSFLQQFPVASAGQDVFYASITLDNAQPPDTNNSLPGAHLIDPDLELLDWHWKRPVQTISQLGSGEKGDVRLVHGASGMFYLPNDGTGSAHWRPLPSGGGGGGLSEITVSDANEEYTGTHIHFTNAEIADLGGGEISVTCPTGSGGGGGSMTIWDAPMSAEYTGASILYLYGFSITEVAPGELEIFAAGGNSLPDQTSWGFSTPSLADDARADTSFDTSVVGGVICQTATILRVEADVPARVIMYESETDQLADIGRPFGTDPTGDHGVLLDVEIGIGGSLRMNPKVIAYTEAGSQFYVSVINQSGSTSVVNLQIVGVPMETA